MRFLLLVTTFFLNVWGGESYYMYGDRRMTLTPLDRSSPNIRLMNPRKNIHYFLDEHDIILGVEKTILLKLQPDANMTTLAKQYRFTPLRQLFDSLFLVEVKEGVDTLECANALHVDKRVVYAHPNFIKENRKR